MVQALDLADVDLSDIAREYDALGAAGRGEGEAQGAERLEGPERMPPPCAAEALVGDALALAADVVAPMSHGALDAEGRGAAADDSAMTRHKGPEGSTGRPGSIEGDPCEGAALFDWSAYSALELYLQHGGWEAVRVLACPLGMSMRGARRKVCKRIRVRLLSLPNARLHGLLAAAKASLEAACRGAA